MCHPVEGSGIHRLMSAFMSNQFLRGYLEVYCAIAFNLTQRLRVDDPLMITVYVGIEPTDTRTFFRLLQPTYHTDETIRGMFQINTIEKIPEGVEITPHRIKSWRDARAREPQNTQVILVEFRRSGHAFSCTTTLTVSSGPLLIARRRSPIRQTSAIYGESEVPMNEASIIEYVANSYVASRRRCCPGTNAQPSAISVSLCRMLNSFIRWDHENICRLQSDMTRFDIDTIRGLVREGDRSEAVENSKSRSTGSVFIVP